MKKPDRNASCPCGSGKKYKKCCLASTEGPSAPSQSAQSLSHNPNTVAKEHYNLGNTLLEQGNPDAAISGYRKALALKPDYAEAYVNLGNVLYEQGKLNEAIENFHKALTFKLNFAQAHYNLGNALYTQDKLDEAAECYRRTLALSPDFADAHNNLGLALQKQGALGAAITSYRKALSLKPSYADAHVNLGNALFEQGNPGDAVASYRRAYALGPDVAKTLSNLLYLHAFTRDIPPEQERDLAANWENIALTEDERSAARERFSGRSDRLPRTGRKLKVGVASAELGQHSVAEFLEPFLEQVDRSRFHITLYPTVTRAEPRAARFMELADEYKSLVGIPDKKAADLIRSDQIDILIDTTGHMNGCRLGVFAHRAAPVQCHYIGYHGTTGLTEMDWYIADGVLLPPTYDAHFRERIWRLPQLRMAYRGDASLPDSHWEPDPDGTVWLGSFNNLAKIREGALMLWAKVMNALPQSKLLLKDIKAADPAVRQRIRGELSRHGISGERVEFVFWSPDWRSHMALYDRLDIALDTIPLNSETTAFDALWMGVPLVTLEGNWVGGRHASTLLKALGKPEWVARNEEEYVAIVAALARDVKGRQSLRASQRSLMADSQLRDVKGLARALEAAFEGLFEEWWKKSGSPAHDQTRTQ
jgi:predicted O-linked N-acetylglucosamine transferase (SPINDLY family)